MYKGAVAIAFGIQTAPSSETHDGRTADNLQKRWLYFITCAVMTKNDKESELNM